MRESGEELAIELALGLLRIGHAEGARYLKERVAADGRSRAPLVARLAAIDSDDAREIAETAFDTRDRQAVWRLVEAYRARAWKLPRSRVVELLTGPLLDPANAGACFWMSSRSARPSTAIRRKGSTTSTGTSRR